MTTTQTTIEPVKIAGLYTIAYNAYRGISFSPEKRAAQIVLDHEGELNSDLAAMPEVHRQWYAEKYRHYLICWLHAKSRVVSPMIAGPSNFPTRRMEKYNNWERNKSEQFSMWRDRALKGIERKEREPKTFLSEIDRYKNELASMKANHEKMKEGNKRILAARKTGEDITEYLKTEFNIVPHMIDWTLKFGFHLANNSANMRRVEDRIKLMELKETRANTTSQQEFKFDGFTVTFNHEADRLQVKHDTKPPYEVIQSFKHAGFRWSPSFGAWQRNLNNNGISAANRLLKINLSYL